MATEDAKVGGETILTSGTVDSTVPEGSKAPGETVLTGDEKTVDAKAPDDKKGDEDKAKAQAGAPEKYEDFKVPEGVDVDKEVLAGFQDLGKKLNLKQEDAQALVDFQAKFMEKWIGDQVKVWDKLRNDWLSEAKADSKIGGPNFEASVEQGKRALKQFGTKELSNLIDVYGFGNHPEFIRFVARIGKELGDDEVTVGNSSNTNPKSLAERIYG